MLSLEKNLIDPSSNPADSSIPWWASATVRNGFLLVSVLLYFGIILAKVLIRRKHNSNVVMAKCSHIHIFNIERQELLWYICSH